MELTQTFNLEDINSNQTSLAKILLVFYVLAASGYTNKLMSKQVQEYIKDNRIVQHIIGFSLMLVLVNLIGGINDTKYALFYALIGYIWFIFSTKLDIHWNIAIFILLFIAYMYDNSMYIKENEIKIDKNLTNDEKIRLIYHNNTIRNTIVGSIIVITIIGTLFYSHKKSEQYGGSYDIFVYMLN